MRRFYIYGAAYLAISVLLLTANAAYAQSISADAGEASLFEVIGERKTDASVVKPLRPDVQDVVPASASPSVADSGPLKGRDPEASQPAAAELDLRVPRETPRLADELRPLAVASQPAYCAIARRIGAGRFTVKPLPLADDVPSTDAISPSAISLIQSAKLALIDDLLSPAQRDAIKSAASPSSMFVLNAVRYPQRPGGRLKVHDVAAGANWDAARWLSQTGETPEPSGARLSDAVRIAWAIAEALTQADPSADQLYFDRAWALTSQLIELRALAIRRFDKLDPNVEFWVTDGYALALAADIGLPVGRWIDPALLSTPSGEWLERLVAAGQGKRIIVLRSTPDAGTEVSRAPIAPTLLEKLTISDVYVGAFRTLCDPSGDYLRTQASNYDVIYRAVAPAEEPKPQTGANARKRGEPNE